MNSTERSPAAHRITKRQSQADRLLALLKAHANELVPLADVIAAGGAQYNARIFELRGRGFRIQNVQQGDRCWFRLVITPPATSTPAVPASVAPKSLTLFDLTP